MSIREVIATINQMEADGVIDRYAIGGAVGATFYLEPVATLDVDVFVTFKTTPGSQLLSLEPVFDYLLTHGGVIEKEYVVIAGFPVQILPPTSGVAEEAMSQALEKDVEGITARVFTAEHLAAVALELGRAKDKSRLVQFVEEGALDIERFESIVERHGLALKWTKFKAQFLDNQP